MPTATASPTSPAKSSRSLISPRSPRSRTWSARRSHPLRFRGNVYVAGWPAWSELDLVGRELEIAGTRLKVVKRIVRCPATNVDPDTGARDLNIPQTLLRNIGHADCGIYAEVIEGGEIAEGDAIEIL